METLTKKVQVASQTNLADKELQKIVSPYFRNVRRCCSVTKGGLRRGLVRRRSDIWVLF